MLFKKESSRNWYYEFTFHGQRVRESTGTKDKQLAKRIMDERRRKLEMGRGGVKEIVKPILFSTASKDWLKLKAADWRGGEKGNTYRIERTNLDHLSPHFGKMLLLDITADDVNLYKATRQKESASEKTIHLEIATLRAIMLRHRLWANIQPDVKMPSAEGEDVGRALEPDEQHRLLVACKASRSRALHPAFLVSLHTGLRSAELRHLQWRHIDLIGTKDDTGEIRCWVTVGRSKTDKGRGRRVPLSDDALACLKNWRKLFPKAQPAHYVFCSERYGLDGEKGHKKSKAVPYSVDPTKPIGPFKDSWDTAREAAGVECTWHDTRHTFISMLAEAGASDAEIMAMAGHVSKRMMDRYSHTRNARKVEAIHRAFNRKPAAVLPQTAIPKDSPQFHPQSGGSENEQIM
jgi:integrase